MFPIFFPSTKLQRYTDRKSIQKIISMKNFCQNQKVKNMLSHKHGYVGIQLDIIIYKFLLL